MLLLTIDIGSSSLRSLVFEADGRPLEASMARSERRFQTSRDGSAVDDPAGLLADLAGCIDQSLHALAARQADLAAVAIAGYAPTLIGLDAANRPLTPLISYADTRSAPDAAALRRELDEHAIFERTGCPLRSNYLPARLRWLRRSRPELFRQVRRWVSLGEYLALQWLDHAAPSVSLAAWSGLLNRHRLQWDEPLLAFLEVEPPQLLSPVDLMETAQLRSRMARRWPALAGLPWLPAIGDGAAANIGSDCGDARRAALTVGTSAALRVTLPAGPAQLPWGLWCYRVDGQRALLGGASSEGGNLFNWLRQVLRIDAAELETVLDQRPPAAHGLTVLPYIAGERSPGWADAASAVLSGLRVSTDAYDIAQAGLEAVAYRFALIAGQLELALDNVPAYIAGGGALQRSPAWCRIFADVLDRPLYVHPAAETTARGLALLAAEVLGRPLEACPPINFLRVHQPDAERHGRYRAALERQQELYRRLIE
jgi:gluconokinase